MGSQVRHSFAADTGQFSMKNPDFLFKNPDFLLNNVDFIMNSGRLARDASRKYLLRGILMHN